MGAEGVRKFVMEKWYGNQMGTEGVKKFVMEKWDRNQMGAESNLFKSVSENLKEILLVIQNFGRYLVGKLEEVFPAESREKVVQWIKVYAPFIITWVFLLICLWFCWVIVVRAVKCMCCCCCSGARKAVKMMKAPGRGYLMPRHAFESDPTSYFRGLRAK